MKQKQKHKVSALSDPLAIASHQEALSAVPSMIYSYTIFNKYFQNYWGEQIFQKYIQIPTYTSFLSQKQNKTHFNTQYY